MKKIIHLSDLHFQLNWEEDQELVLHAFFKDLSKQIEGVDINDIVFIFSGDVVRAGEDISLYDKFIELFDVELNKLKINKEKRYCVPGNHDISVAYVKNNFVVHEGIVSQDLNEKKI
jgi:predicted MPP superfamily phosphohydrolase